MRRGNEGRKNALLTKEIIIDSGILRFTVHECTELRGPTTITRMNPYVRVIINGEEKLRTSHAWHNTTDPVYEAAGEAVVMDKNEAFVRVEVKGWRKVHEDELLGVWTCRLADMLAKQEENGGWWIVSLNDAATGNIRLSAQWKPVVMAGLTTESMISGHGYDGK